MQAPAALERRMRFWRGVAATLTGGALWGFSGACAQFLLSNYQVDPLFVTAARMLAAGAIFLAVLVATRREQLCAMLRDKATAVQLVVFGAGGLYLSQITYTIVIGFTNAGTATVLQCTGIAFVMLFTCALTRRLPQLREFVGLIAAVAATWLIATQGDPAVLAVPIGALVWGLANGLSAAFYIMYPRRLFERWGSFAPTGLGMFVGGIAASAVLLVNGAANRIPLVPELDGTGWLMVAVIVVIGTFAAFGLYLHGVSIVGPVKGSLLSAIEPVSAALFSALWLGTAFTGADWAGTALMIAMIVFVTKPKKASEGAAVQ